MALHPGVESRVDKTTTRHGDAQTGAALLGNTWSRGDRTTNHHERNRHSDAADTPTPSERKTPKADVSNVDCARTCPFKDHNRAASYMNRSGDSDAFTRNDARALKTLDLNSGKPMTEAQMTALQHLRKHAMDDDGKGQPLWKQFAPEDPSARAAFKNQMFGGNADYQEEVANSYRPDTSESVQQYHRDNVASYGENLPTGPTFHEPVFSDSSSLSFSTASIYPTRDTSPSPSSSSRGGRADS